MTIVEGSGTDQELMRLWSLIAELSEELNQNRSLAVSLYSQATNVKVSELSSIRERFRHGHTRRIKLYICRRGLYCAGLILINPKVS